MAKNYVEFFSSFLPKWSSGLPRSWNFSHFLRRSPNISICGEPSPLVTHPSRSHRVYIYMSYDNDIFVISKTYLHMKFFGCFSFLVLVECHTSKHKKKIEYFRNSFRLCLGVHVQNPLKIE